MTHLGEAASAFVDGALDDETAWRVSAHVANCRSCRAEIDAERALKDQLGAVPAQTAMPSGLAAALLGIAAQPMAVAHGCAPATAAASSRRPAARVAQAAPRGRGDVGGPGRAVRSTYRRVGGRYVAAAGLAASVMVGLGGGALGTGGGTFAGGPPGAAASTPARNAASSSMTPAELAVSSSLSSLLPVAGRSIVRPSTRAALSVVYRQP